MKYIDITSEELKQLIKTSNNVVMIDVRELKEWNQGKIEGAFFLPLGELTLDKIYDLCEDNADTEKTVNIVFYCRSGVRSVHAILNLFDPSVFNPDDLPFDIQLYNLKYGILEYEK